MNNIKNTLLKLTKLTYLILYLEDEFLIIKLNKMVYNKLDKDYKI